VELKLLHQVHHMSFLAITKVYLRPQVTFAPENLPTDDELEKMHHEAHHNCFLANSVKTEIIIETNI
jgi:organic hydroperoxide reductase OsmC/OhrA